MIGFLRQFQSNQFPKAFLFLFIFFLLIFPKGGIKIGPVPITWGYLLLGAAACLLSFRKYYRVNKNHLRMLMILLPFQTISLLTILLNGYTSFSATLSFFVSFFFLPFAFFFVFSEYFETFDEQLFEKLFRNGIFFVASYGIFLFFFKLYTGRFLEIPFLTVNYHDLGELEKKHINRGSVFKLISTYNNGNIYGICILMWLALYCHLENKSWKKIVVKLSLLLTISRTVWLGLFFSECLYDLFIAKNKKLFLIKFSIASFFFGGLLFLIAWHFGFNKEFFLDLTFGGRSEQLDFIKTAGFFSKESFSGFSEMVYFSALHSFGYAGFFCFFFTLCSPLILHFLTHFYRPFTPTEKALNLGLLTYLFVSLSDAAMLYIPTMAVYWMVAAILLRRRTLQLPKDQQIQKSYSSSIEKKQIPNLKIGQP